jgi:hypothetical protein
MGSEVLSWHFQPEGDSRSHRNPSPLPEGLPRRDFALIHEHPWIEPHGTMCSRPLFGLDKVGHEDAFNSFCGRANIDPGTVYKPPPEPQLSLLP